MTLHYALVALLVILQVLDVMTTRAALKVGAVEANPLMRPIIEKAGVKGLVLAKVGFIALIGAFHSALSPVVLGALVALYTFIVVNNVRVARQLSK